MGDTGCVLDKEMQSINLNPKRFRIKYAQEGASQFTIGPSSN